MFHGCQAQVLSSETQPRRFAARSHVEKAGTKKGARRDPSGDECMTNEEQIAHSWDRIRRRAERMGELASLYNPRTGHCCPSCASSEYRDLCEKQTRSVEWLGIQLVKRGTAEDMDRALRLVRDYGAKGILVFIEKRKRRTPSET